jgi:hypothetical protein
MEPIPETRAAAALLGEGADGLGGMDLIEGLQLLARAALEVAPSCIGVSLTIVVDGEPATLTATSPALAGVDAAQYLGGGPCVDAAETGEAVAVDDVLDEDRWQYFGQAATAVGVRSSVSMPFVVTRGEVNGALNLYAGDPHGFVGKADQLAAVFGVPVADLVTNADLSFMTRNFARELPRKLEEQGRVDRAVGALAVDRGWTPTEAERRLRTAANQAGVPLSEVADIVLALGAT